MALAYRYNVNDFIAQVNNIGVTSLGNRYVASLNTNGSVKVTKNGTVIYDQMIWGDKGCALTDANVSGDTIRHPSGRVADSAQFIQLELI